MEHILLVEADPIVLLDVSEGLRAAMPATKITDLSLDDAFALLSQAGDLSKTALVTSTLPEDTAQLAALMAQGLKVILTNTAQDLLEATLGQACYIERPFDANSVIELF